MRNASPRIHTPVPLHGRTQLVVSIALCLFCNAAPAMAQPAEEAGVLYQKGVRLYHEHALQEALEAMLASHRLVPNANVAFNVAQIYALLDQPTLAFNWYQRHLNFELPAKERALAEARIKALIPRVAVVDVRSSPDGARLFLDRVELGSVGQAPTRLAIAPGASRIIGTLSGYRPASVSFDAVRGKLTPVVLELERLTTGVSLQSRPAGASVYLDGRQEPIGKTPLKTTLPVGPLRLRLELTGHLPITLERTLREQQTLDEQVTMRPDPAQLAQLHVHGSPVGANVTINEGLGERLPLELTDLEPGTYSVRVERPAHESWSGRLELAAGLRTDLEVSLEVTSEPWKGWPYLGYIGGSALIVSGAIVGISAVVDRNNGNRDIQTRNNVADVLMISGAVVLVTTWIFTSLLAKEQAPSRATKTSRPVRGDPGPRPSPLPPMGSTQ